MKKNDLTKTKRINSKTLAGSAFIYVINTILIALLFLAIVSMNHASGNSDVTVKEFLSEPTKFIYFVLLLAVFSTLEFVYTYFFKRKVLNSIATVEMFFLIVELAIVINYVIGIYISVYLRPIALVAILIEFLFDRDNALFNGILFSCLVFVIDFFVSVSEMYVMVVTLVSSIASSVVGVLIVDKAYSRMRLMFKSIFVSLYPIINITIMLLNSQKELTFNSLTKEYICSLTSGPLTMAIFMVVLPFFEVIFSKYTRFKLAELTDHNSKLIKRLIEEAPGTFNHSIVVSNIAEACATAIDEDALLARTCAYYHDIGKLRHPEYFGENNSDGESPHDGLTPELSTNIIKAHATDGYKVLIKYGFPKEIAEVCRQHHGTMPIYYFYDKAKKFTDGEVNIANYCYAGPRPQSKIAAILMIADSSEAAVRTLTDRSREKVRKTVEKIVKDRMDLGQFDDSDLTLKEISIIIDTIVNNITGIYHKRVEYPNMHLLKAQKEEVRENTETLKGLDDE